MKAAVRTKYGRPKDLEILEMQIPIPNDNEILIKNFATTVNRTDCANLTAKPFIMRFVLGLFKPRKVILGTDFAGEIIQVGKHMKSFKTGDKVFGFADTGLESQSEYICLKAEEVFHIPENIGFKQAAAALEGAHYAYTFVHKVDIKSGQSIFINGATGAIGSALLQFVRQYEVHITASCNTKNIELLKSLGADRIIDYTEKDFTAENIKYDYIFDAVGKSTFGKCRALLNSRGVYISSELGPFSQNIFYAIISPLLNRKLIFPVPFNQKITIPFISELLDKGNFKPVIDREYHLSEIKEAYQYVIKGNKTGNVVINIQ